MKNFIKDIFKSSFLNSVYFAFSIFIKTIYINNIYLNTINYNNIKKSSFLIKY